MTDTLKELKAKNRKEVREAVKAIKEKSKAHLNRMDRVINAHKIGKAKPRPVVTLKARPSDQTIPVEKNAPQPTVKSIQRFLKSYVPFAGAQKVWVRSSPMGDMTSVPIPSGMQARSMGVRELFQAPIVGTELYPIETYLQVNLDDLMLVKDLRILLGLYEQSVLDNLPKTGTTYITHRQVWRLTENIYSEAQRAYGKRRPQKAAKYNLALTVSVTHVDTHANFSAAMIAEAERTQAGLAITLGRDHAGFVKPVTPIKLRELANA